MSYAGTFGPDETCEHDHYWKSCWRCNGNVERFAREYPARMTHADDAAKATITERRVTLYSACCPNTLCSWARINLENRAELDAAIAEHVAKCRSVAAEWSNSEVLTEAKARGLL